MSAPRLSLVIPAFNEARRLPASIRAIRDFAPSLGCSWELVIVVEKSTDDTLALAREAAAGAENIRILAQPDQRGKGRAVREGMLAATGDIALFMDADLSVPLAEIPAFLRHLDAHPECDILIGNRQHAQSRITRAQPWIRRKMGQTFNRILRFAALADLRDTQCGFKAFRRAASQRLFALQSLDGFAFDVEILLLAQRLGLTVRDQPVEWINSPDSHVHILRDSVKMLADVLRIRRRVARLDLGTLRD